MTPTEAENLKWGLVHMNEAAHQLRQAHENDPDAVEDARYEAENAIGRFLGMADVYTASEPKKRKAPLGILASALVTAHRKGKTTIEYGAVEGAIQALTERRP